MLQESISFKSEVWLWSGGKAAWHFVTLPKENAAQVKFFVGERKTKGWGSVPVKATIGNTSWQTSIFPDKKRGSYILPLKAEVRKKEKISQGKEAEITLLLNL